MSEDYAELGNYELYVKFLDAWKQWSDSDEDSFDIEDMYLKLDKTLKNRGIPPFSLEPSLVSAWVSKYGPKGKLYWAGDEAIADWPTDVIAKFKYENPPKTIAKNPYWGVLPFYKSHGLHEIVYWIAYSRRRGQK